MGVGGCLAWLVDEQKVDSCKPIAISKKYKSPQLN